MPTKKKKPRSTKERGQPWLMYEINNDDRKRIRQLAKEMFEPNELDHTDGANMHRNTELMITELAEERDKWRLLTPDKQFFTVPKYASLYSFIC